MRYKVTKQQNVASKCFICGIHNDKGLHTKYYELENSKVVGVFEGDTLHQSFPGRMHGGIIAALLDETIGRAMQIGNPERWSVTAELTTRYLKPMPLNETLYVVGWIENSRRNIHYGEGYICNKNMEILATAKAKFFETHIKDILHDHEHLGDEWIYEDDTHMPDSFELPK